MSAISRMSRGLSIALVAVLLAVLAATGPVHALEADRKIVSAMSTYTFKQLHCANHQVNMWFYTVQDPSAPESAASFNFKADSTAVGGYKIMGAFKANNGTTYTKAEGFDPCVYTTCLGVTCASKSEFLVQNYVNPLVYLFGAASPQLQFYDYGVSLATTPRCACFKADLSSPIPNQRADAFAVDPTGPSAERSNPVCAKLACDRSATANVLYYLNSTDNKAASCQCCKKTGNRIGFNWDAEDEPNQGASCGVVKPFEVDHATSSSSGAGPAPDVSTSPAPIPTTFLSFVENACPADVLSGVSTSAVVANNASFCCYLTSAYDSTVVSYYCGDDLLDVHATGTLNCVSSVPDNRFTCCASLAFSGGVSTTGRVCEDSIRKDNKGDGSSAVASTVLAALATAAIALYSAYSA